MDFKYFLKKKKYIFFLFIIISVIILNSVDMWFNFQYYWAVFLFFFLLINIFIYRKKNTDNYYKLAIPINIIIFIFGIFLSFYLHATDGPTLLGFPLTHIQIGCGWCIEPCSACVPGFKIGFFIINLISWGVLFSVLSLITKKLDK